MSVEFGTLFTFVPAVVAHSSVDITQHDSSQTMDEVFRAASWCTTADQNLPGNSNLYSFSPFPFDLPTAQDMSEETLMKLAKSREDFVRAVQSRNDFENKLKELAKTTEDDSSLSPPTAQKYESIGASTGGTQHSSVPKSYEEIYQVSVRNRQRTKDKKRTREGEGDVNKETDKSTTTLAGSAMITAGCFDYFSEKERRPLSSAVQSTLDFASEVGWIKDAAQRNDIEESHQRDLLSAQAVVAGEGGADGGEASDLRASGSGSSTLRRSGDRGKKTSQAAAALNVSGGRLPSQPPKVFDYSRLVQGPIGAASAQGLNNMRSSGEGPAAGADAREGKPKANSKQANKSQPFRVKQEIVNPYLFGSGMGDER